MCVQTAAELRNRGIFADKNFLDMDWENKILAPRGKSPSIAVSFQRENLTGNRCHRGAFGNSAEPQAADAVTSDCCSAEAQEKNRRVVELSGHRWSEAWYDAEGGVRRHPCLQPENED